MPASKTETKKNIAVLISGSGSNLQSFIDSAQNGELNANIALVISNRPGVQGLERAQNAGIKSLVVDHKLYSEREDFEQALIDALDAHKLDAVVLAGFMRILTPKFVCHYKGRLFNIHPSLLPKYPGLHTHRRAIEANDSHGGATVHFVTEELDGGPAVLQAAVEILENETEQTLAKRVLTHEHIIYPLAVQWFLENKLELRDDKAYLNNQALDDTGYLYQDGATSNTSS